ncbi:MAG: hypothetical protein KatS3mg082_2495 [Nitrospiraceae bacterium]|nr:MAG: hypothetical protein KatS3mg082_2495 [Nitrospiraceae bacterium]
MRILWTFHDAGHPATGGNQRVYALSKHWVRMGHEVTIASASFSHLRYRQPEPATTVREDFVDGIRYIWIPTREFHSNGLQRAINMFEFAFGLRKWMISVPLNVDVVICASVHGLDIYPCASFAKRVGSLLVREIRDIWPMTLIEIGHFAKWHPFVILLGHAESLALRKSQLIVSNLPAYGVYLEEKFRELPRWIHVPNGVEPDHKICKLGCDSCASHRAHLNNLRRSQKFIVLYAGAHGPANNLEIFVDVLERMTECHVHFVFIGDGPSKQNLIRATAGRGSLATLHFSQRVPPPCARGLMEDGGLSHIEPQTGRSVEIWCFAEQSVRVHAGGEADRLVRSCGQQPGVSKRGCGMRHGQRAGGDRGGDPEARARMRAGRAGGDGGPRADEYVLEHHAYPETRAAQYAAGARRRGARRGRQHRTTGDSVLQRDVPPARSGGLGEGDDALYRGTGADRRMGRESRRIAEERFDVRRVNARILEVLGLP